MAKLNAEEESEFEKAVREKHERENLMRERIQTKIYEQ